MPNAPTPNSSLLKVSLKNNPAPLAENVQTPSSARPLPAEDVSLYTVVDLALRNCKPVLIAEASQQRARAALSETRDVYIPTFSIGSGLGYSYGFPLGNPTLFNVNSNFLLFSFSQRDYIRSAHAALKSITLSLKNTRQQVILDAALNYMELNKTLSQIVALHEAVADTDKMLGVVEDRLRAGLETNIQLTQVQLTRAQIQLRAIQMEDHADELRQHLAGLTGLPPDAITPAASSVPELPDLDFPSLLKSAGKSPVVQAEAAMADAKMYSSWGDKRQNYRPTVLAAFQYNRFSSFNGYDQYYRSFQPNNIGIGIQATWPLFDSVRKTKADESKAEAIRERHQAELTQIQDTESNYKLWHSLRELEAQERVAVLQQQLAQATLGSMVTQMNHVSTANGAPVTPQQAEQSRIEERTSYVDMRDAEFNVTKVKLNLLNAVGELEDWAKQSDHPGH